MNISANGKTVAALTKELALHWRATTESWADTRSREFEQKFINDLLASVERAVPVFENLDKVIKKIRSDCE